MNAATKMASCHLPIAAELFADLRSGTVSHTLDLAQAYQQLKVTEETAAVLTVNTHRGLYRVKRLPFGVSAATSIFQRAMDTTLVRIAGVSVYLNDLIVSGGYEREHAEHIDAVLFRLKKVGLRLRQEKCTFATMEVTLLGLKIDAAGVHTKTEKVQAILAAPEPTRKTTVHVILGLLAFYDRFFENRATIAGEPIRTIAEEHALALGITPSRGI